MTSIKLCGQRSKVKGQTEESKVTRRSNHRTPKAFSKRNGHKLSKIDGQRFSMVKGQKSKGKPARGSCQRGPPGPARPPRQS
eukprot:3135470-Rhodomonas_salina.1